MAAKNSIKNYVPESYFHIYNRGVEKRDIFLDQQDFSVFLSYLKIYLEPKDEMELCTILGSPESTSQDKSKALKLLNLKNFYEDIDLHCYALLPNHFHLLLRQTSGDGIDRFMNALGVRYSVYFNHKYHRVGPLFQGVYKAVLVTTDEQLLHLSRYIHLNTFHWLEYPLSRRHEIHLPSSLPEYLQERHTGWINTEQILGFFTKEKPGASYLQFFGEPSDSELIAQLTLDDLQEVVL